MNSLTSIPELPNSLYYFDCDHNFITQLPNLPGSLGVLWCFNNHLTSIPQLPLTLFELNCDSNFITTLSVLPQSIQNVICSNNLLSSLPTLPDTLNELWCYNNPDLHCLPSLNRISSFKFDTANIKCVPNYGPVYSNPRITTLPLCSSLVDNPCSATSVEEIADLSSKFRFAPNPTSGSTNIFIDASMIGATLNITDVSGRRVNSIQIQTTTYNLETNTLSNGIYFLQLIAQGNTVVKQLVKQ